MAKRPKMRFPQPLGEVVHDGLAALGIAGRLQEAEIWRVWPEIVGAVVASRAMPLRIIKGTLTVAVSSGPWMQELRFLVPMIRDKLNTRLGGELVTTIVLKTGKVESLSFEQPPEEIPQKKRLTPRQKTLIEEQSAEIVDPDTRVAFAALMKASFESR